MPCEAARHSASYILTIISAKSHYCHYFLHKGKAQDHRVGVQSQFVQPPKFRPFPPDHWPLTLNFRFLPVLLEVRSVWEFERCGAVQGRGWDDLEIGSEAERLPPMPHSEDCNLWALERHQRHSTWKWSFREE